MYCINRDGGGTAAPTGGTDGIALEFNKAGSSEQVYFNDGLNYLY
jgi:hypothetical protein